MLRKILILVILVIGVLYLLLTARMLSTKVPVSGMPIAHNVIHYGLNPHKNVLYTIGYKPASSQYSSSLVINEIDITNNYKTRDLGTISIGSGITNAQPILLIGDTHVAVFARDYVATEEDNYTNICKIINLNTTEEDIQIGDAIDAVLCTERMFDYTTVISNTQYPYSPTDWDTIVNSTKFQFKENGATLAKEIHNRQLDQNTYTTTYFLGDTNTTFSGGFTLSSTGYFVDNKCLYLVINNNLYCLKDKI